MPYVNNEPHLGNIIGCVLSADAFARYARLRGDNAMYICGTDEYGTATEIKALSEGVSCQELCDRFFEVHRQIYDDFEIDFDHFGRTTNLHQRTIAQDIFLKLKRNGHLVYEDMQQLYCSSCARFLADRYVEGVCPHCAYPDARGDQCDGCQKLLNAVELVNPRCKYDGERPEPRLSKHLFLDLAKFQSQLAAHVEKHCDDKWSSNAVSVTRGWLQNPLQKRCITRDLKWGTPVPVCARCPATGEADFDLELAAEFAPKVFYVWFDAPIGYPSITASLTPHWERWWKPAAEDDVRLHQFMGKDNTPFHTIIFPASLMGTGDPWTLVRHISTTEFLNYEGTKFSKSRGVGVFGSHVRTAGIAISAWRYYLLSVRPETSDTDFSWADFVARNNNELLKNPGNLVNRIVKFSHALFGGRVPDHAAAGEKIDEDFYADISHLVAQYNREMDALKLRAGLQTAMAVSARANVYLSECCFNNLLFDTDRRRCALVLVNCLDSICILSAMLYPFIPSTSAAINRQLGLPAGYQPTLPLEADFDAGFPRAFLVGHVLGQQEYLFEKLDAAIVESMREKFSQKPANESAR